MTHLSYRLIQPSDPLFPYCVDDAAGLIHGYESDYSDVVDALMLTSVAAPDTARWTVFETDSGGYAGHALVRVELPVVTVMTARVYRPAPGVFRAWRQETTAWARAAGARDILWWTERDPAAFERLTGGRHYTTTYRLEIGADRNG